MRPLRRHLLLFGMGVLLVLVAAPLMADAAQSISVATGVGETFVGVALLALATSLPELVTSLAAVRMGSFELAVGNLFGSNALNVAILIFADAAYTRGPILSAVF